MLKLFLQSHFRPHVQTLMQHSSVKPPRVKSCEQFLPDSMANCLWSCSMMSTASRGLISCCIISSVENREIWNVRKERNARVDKYYRDMAIALTLWIRSRPQHTSADTVHFLMQYENKQPSVAEQTRTIREKTGHQLELGPFKVAFLSKWGFHPSTLTAVNFSHEYSFWFVSMCMGHSPWKQVISSFSCFIKNRRLRGFLA